MYVHIVWIFNVFNVVKSLTLCDFIQTKSARRQKAKDE